MIKTILIAVSIATCSYIWNLAYSESFDCTRTTTHVEKMICSNPDLSIAEKVETLCKKEIIRLIEEEDKIKREEHQWLETTRNACKDVDCLFMVYKERISHFKSKLTTVSYSKFLSEGLMEIERHQWKQYKVVVYKTMDEDWPDQVVQIQDRHGKVIREIHGQTCHVKFAEMTGSGVPELYVETFSGGSCCGTEYYFTQDGGLRNLLIFIGGSRGILGLKDLNGDGRPELIAASDVLAYFGGLSHGASPNVIMVIGWDGKQYRNQTQNYPAIAREEAREYRDEFLSYLKDFKQGDRSAALGYYVNMLVIGEGAAARAWLLKHADKDTREWLFSGEEGLRVALGEHERKICVSQEHVLEFDGVGMVCPNGDD